MASKVSNVSLFMNYLKFSLFLILSFFIILSSSCKKEDKVTVSHEVIAQPSTKNHSLFYSGKIESLVLSTISSPIEGRVKTINVAYGDFVAKDQVIFELESNGVDDNTAEVIVDYLKNKDQISIAEAKLKNEKKLFEAGIIAKNEYTDLKRMRDIDYINFIKSKAKIQDLLNIIGLDISNINKIKLDDVSQITNIINMHNSIPIRANNKGIFLRSSEKNAITLMTGVELKKGNSVGVIANQDEIKVNISVPETDINKIHVGQKVIVTGDGFAGIELEGTVDSLNLYNIDNSGSGTEVSYPVVIRVPNISESILTLVHVGMSAKVEISQHMQGKYFVPVNAVKVKNNTTTVNKVSKSGQVLSEQVKVGRTTPDSIEILSGIDAGERIVFYD
ncbi:MAG: HlyD family efflux transporter periplasmic adaptor subunit [Pseudomonadota bacterium]|nr:HlyD family efflux transporter periplasmic adaptor subunit [Pseudomonadota bacterium]